mgnify:CR=1 FL=1
MLGSRWIIAVALGLVSSLALQAQENKPEPKIQPDATQEQPAVEPLPVKPTIPLPTDEASAEHDESGAKDTQSKPQQVPSIVLGDGWAQWAMALTGLGALLVSIWAVRLLKATLKETRDAVRAADAAVGVTREIGEAQARAYLSIQDIEVSGLTGQSSALVKFKIRNTGMTPARNLVWCGNAFVTDTFLRSEKARPESLAPELYKNEIGAQAEKLAEIGASGTRGMNTRITNDQITRIIMHQAHLFCLIEIVYSDVFACKYKINATYRISVDSLAADGSGKFLMTEFSEEKMAKNG